MHWFTLRFANSTMEDLHISSLITRRPTISHRPTKPLSNTPCSILLFVAPMWLSSSSSWRHRPLYGESAKTYPSATSVLQAAGMKTGYSRSTAYGSALLLDQAIMAQSIPTSAFHASQERHRMILKPSHAHHVRPAAWDPCKGFLNA